MLIRHDIIQGLKRLYDAVKDEGINRRALALIETEADLKCRKKYSTVWRDRPAKEPGEQLAGRLGGVLR